MGVLNRRNSLHGVIIVCVSLEKQALSDGYNKYSVRLCSVRGQYIFVSLGEEHFEASAKYSVKIERKRRTREYMDGAKLKNYMSRSERDAEMCAEGVGEVCEQAKHRCMRQGGAVQLCGCQ